MPGGESFDLRSDEPGHYLYHSSALGTFTLGSDAITHSYKNQIKKKWLMAQMPEAVQELFDCGSTIGAYIVFPNNQVNRRHTINQARGVSRFIDDRFDLTLECIRRFYTGEPSPLADCLKRYESFFRLFKTFANYVEFFLLDDLVDAHGKVKFYLPFDGFQSPPEFKGVEGYLIYKSRVESFVKSRNKRIENYAARIEA